MSGEILRRRVEELIGEWKVWSLHVRDKSLLKCC